MSGEDMGGVGAGNILIRIHCIKKFSKRKEKSKVVPLGKESCLLPGDSVSPLQPVQNRT